MEINANTNNAYAVAVPRQPDVLTSTESDAENTAYRVEKTAQSFRQIALKYEVANISPYEIDQLAADLRKSGQAGDKDILMLETRGAKFL